MYPPRSLNSGSSRRAMFSPQSGPASIQFFFILLRNSCRNWEGWTLRPSSASPAYPGAVNKGKQNGSLIFPAAQEGKGSCLWESYNAMRTIQGRNCSKEVTKIAQWTTACCSPRTWKPISLPHGARAHFKKQGEFSQGWGGGHGACEC